MPPILDCDDARPQISPALPYANPATPGAQRQAAAPLSRWDVASIVVRLAGAYLIVLQGLPALAEVLGVASAWRTRFDTRLGVFYSSLFVLFCGTGLCLFLYADTIAGWLLSKTELTGAPPESPSSARHVQEIAFSIMGVYLMVVYAIPGIALNLWRWISQPSGTLAALPASAPYLIEHLIQLLAGFWLFFGSKQLAGYWRRRHWQSIDSSPADGPL